MSRITLEVTDVRVERVQDISEEDALAEGIVECNPGPEGPKASPVYRPPGANDFIGGWSARPAFRRLWDEINAARGHPWDANDWVWAVSFSVVEVRQ